MKKFANLFLLFVFGFVPIAFSAITPISQIKQNDANGVPLMNGQNVTVRGIATVANHVFSTTNTDFFIQDATGGVDIFGTGVTKPVAMGDTVEVVGKVSQFNGLTEVVISASTDITIINSGNPLPNPIVLTCSQYLSNPEYYEGSLVKINGVTVKSGSIPASGSNGTIYITDNGTDSIAVYIDKDTNIDGTPTPTKPFNIVAIGGQYDNSSPYNSGYQIKPRALSDIITGSTTTIVPISQIKQNDANGVPLMNGQNVTVRGIATVSNHLFQPTNTDFFIQDATGGVNIYGSGVTKAVAMGDTVEVVGKVSQYNGLTEVVITASTNITIINSGNPLPNPIVLTCSQYLSNPEYYEGSLVKIYGVTVKSGSIPASGSNGTVYITDNGTDSVAVYIDKDTDIDGSTAPTVFNVIAIGGQFDNSSPYNSGYQIKPRALTDIINATTVTLDRINTNLVPTSFNISQNYPNPFNPITQITYQIPEKANVSINVYNVKGELIRTLVNSEHSAGYYKVVWNGKDNYGNALSSGVYIYRMESGKFSSTKKMIMMK